MAPFRHGVGCRFCSARQTTQSAARSGRGSCLTWHSWMETASEQSPGTKAPNSEPQLLRRSLVKHLQPLCSDQSLHECPGWLPVVVERDHFPDPARSRQRESGLCLPCQRCRDLASGSSLLRPTDASRPSGRCVLRSYDGDLGLLDLTLHAVAGSACTRKQRSSSTPGSGRTSPSWSPARLRSPGMRRWKPRSPGSESRRPT